MVILNSSTSSSKSGESTAAWRSFVRLATSTLVTLAMLCYGFVLFMDPYDNLPFSADFDRPQVASPQRLFYPALARKAHFDSAIFGNSNIRLLRPGQLNTLLDGQFVNLGMDAASAWEQEQIFRVFIRNHDSIKNVLFGIDYLWCMERYADMKFVGKNTPRVFPLWMYDERTDNNLPPLNSGSVKHSWRQLLVVTGVSENEYGSDGYTVFTKPSSEYDLNKARMNIYASSTPKEIEPVSPPHKMNSEERSKIPIPALDRLGTMLEALPDEARKILFFVPYHSYFQARPGSQQEIVWNECKKRAVDLASVNSNAYVLDFMIRSDITKKDSNYWDYKHYTVEIAEKLGVLIGAAINDGVEDENFRLLYLPSD